jgi:hypothetical protein
VGVVTVLTTDTTSYSVLKMTEYTMLLWGNIDKKGHDQKIKDGNTDATR